MLTCDHEKECHFWYIQQVQKWKNIKRLETRKYPRWDHHIPFSHAWRFLSVLFPRGANVYVRPVVVRFILAALVSRALPQSVQASGISRDTSGTAPCSILRPCTYRGTWIILVFGNRTKAKVRSTCVPLLRCCRPVTKCLSAAAYNFVPWFSLSGVEANV